jgi:uncharacterized membrane protein
MTMTFAPVRPRTPIRIRSGGTGSPLAWSLAGALFLLYAALAVRDQQRMMTGGFDLGIFDETVRSYAYGHLPIVPLKGTDFDELGDHFSPIWALIAPAYRIFPTVYTLLITQAALLAVAAVPLVRWAAQACGRRTALVVGAGYGLSWGIASAAGFDVHEVAFAVPMLAYSTTALAHRRWRAAVAWGLPLLLVKEDLGFTLAAIGVYIAFHGARRLGAAAAITGVLGSILEVELIIPAFSRGGSYTYSGSISSAFDGGLFGLPQTVLRFITPETKVVTVVLMLAVTGFAALRSPITLLVVPTLGWRFLSADQAYWGTAFQYSAVLMPIVFAGFIDALVRLRAQGESRYTPMSRTFVFTSLAVTLALFPDTSLWSLAEASTWHTDPRVAVARRDIAEIPPNATVAAGNQLIPQLTDRDTVLLLDMQTPGSDPAWVLMDTENPDNFPLNNGQQTQLIAEFRADGYQTVSDEAGYLLLKEH